MEVWKCNYRLGWNGPSRSPQHIHYAGNGEDLGNETTFYMLFNHLDISLEKEYLYVYFSMVAIDHSNRAIKLDHFSPYCIYTAWI